MLSAQYIGDGKIEIAEREERPPGPGEVQISVAYVGLCGTDIHILHGSMDQRVNRPLIFGHEMSGTISALGQDVTGWAVGDQVTVMPLGWDGTCPACESGNSHICHNLNFLGIDSPGAMQGRWNVLEKMLVRLPQNVQLDHAALVEPVAVAVHDVRRANISPGDKAVVIGGGPIGVLVATVARNFGADVLVIEVDASRRQQITELGFDVLDPISTDQAAHVESWTRGAGADVVFEVSGAASAVLGATSLAKARGVLVIVAIHPTPRPIDLQRVFWRELTILGARVYEKKDFEKAVDLIADGQIPASTLITKIVKLSETSLAFQELSSGKAMKVLVDVGGQK